MRYTIEADVINNRDGDMHARCITTDENITALGPLDAVFAASAMLQGQALLDEIVVQAQVLWNQDINAPQQMDAATDDVYVILGKGDIHGPVRP